MNDNIRITTTNPCELDGTCDHTDAPSVIDFCKENPEASFCSGPSMRECPGANDVPEDQLCPGNDTTALGDPHEGEFDWLECADGSEPNEYHQCPVPINTEREACFDAGGAWTSDGTCTETATPAPAPVDTLPETGINDALFGTALAMIAFGVGLLRYVRN